MPERVCGAGVVMRGPSLWMLVAAAVAMSVGSSGAYGADSAAQEIQSLTMEWTNAIAMRASQVISDPRLWAVSQAIYIALAAILLLRTMWNWPSRGVDVPEFIAVGVRLLIVQTLLLKYDEITRALYVGVDALGRIYQQALIGTDEPFDSAFSLIQRVASTVIVEGESSWWDVMPDVMNVVTVAVVALVQAAFCVLVAAVSIWVFLGYTLMKLIGFLFVPLLVSAGAARWFEKWFALFMGFLLFGFLSRVVLALALIGAEVGTGVMNDGMGQMIRLTSIWDAVALLVFYGLCGYAIYRSGTFAATLSQAGLALQDPLGRVSQAIGRQFR